MCDVKEDRIAGAVLGLALGDALGAPHEGGLAERALWAVIGRRGGKRRWTDDTQMTIDVIESLLACGRVDRDDLARRFARSYRWSRGYGPGTARVLKRMRRGQSWQSAATAAYRGGSFGNGGAMRAPAVGLFFADGDEAELADAARASAEVTHAHRLGREGAVVTALATALAYNDAAPAEMIDRLCRCVQADEFLSSLRKAGAWLQAGGCVEPSTVAAELGNGVAAAESCVTAVYAASAFRQRPFDDLMKFVIALGGDVDTIAAMACAVWAAARGVDALPEVYLQQLEQRDRLAALAKSLAAAAAENR